jgi:hypothetical protein
MKDFSRGSLFFLALLLQTVLYSQSSLLKGTVVDSLDSPLPGASILLKSINDSTQTQGTSTAANGTFEVRVSPGYYTFHSTFIGYQLFSKTIVVEYEEVDLGKIILSENSYLLGEATVIGKLLSVIIKGDTTEINANAYKSNPDANASDLIQKMPTIVVSGGKVQAEGEDVKKVLVDGKPFFGNDPNSALSSLPAEVIDKIQIFDDLSDQAKLTGFDDGNSEKTINIVTKKEFRNGTFGNVSGGYGTDDRFRLNGLLNYFKDDQRITIMGQSNNINVQNFSSSDLAGVASSSSRRGGGRGGTGGSGSVSGNASDFLIGEQDGIVNTNAFGINYTDQLNKKLSLNASYFYNRTDNYSVTNLERTYFNDVDAQNYFEQEIANTTNVNHRFNLRLKYDISESDAIIYTPSFTLQQYDGQNELSTASLLNDTILSSYRSNFQSELQTYNLENRLMWQHKFGKKGRTFSAMLSHEYSPTNAESSLGAIDASDAFTSALDQISEQDQLNQSVGLRLDYTEPLTDKLMLRLNYSPSLDMGSSEQLTFSYDSTSGLYNQVQSQLSNTFSSEYLLHEGGAGLMYRNGRKNFFLLNLNYQWASFSTEQEFPQAGQTQRNFNAILPMAMWRSQFSENSNLRLRLRARTSIPSISQLQNVLDNTNPLQLSIGNPLLDQQYQYSLNARYSRTNPTSGSSLFFGMQGSLINDYIGTSTTIALSDTITVSGVELSPGTQLSEPVNLDGYYNLSVFGTYGFPLSKIKSNLNLNLTAQYSRNPGILNRELNYTANPSIGFGAVLSSNISEKVDFTLSSNSSKTYSLSSLSPNQNTDYFNQSTTAKAYWNLWKGLVVRTSLSHQYYAGLSDSFDPNYFLWGAGLGYKFMKDNKAEIGLEAFDILGQNQALSRATTETYYEDISTNTLQQYVMLTFRYNFDKFISVEKDDRPKSPRD